MVLSFFGLSVVKIHFRDKPKKECRRKEKRYTKQEFDKTKGHTTLEKHDNGTLKFYSLVPGFITRIPK